MQTILKVICDNRGQTQIVNDYVATFCAKLTSESSAMASQRTNFDFPETDDVAFVEDDCQEPLTENDDEVGKRLRLGSFGPLPNQVNKNTQLIFVNPIILSYWPNGRKYFIKVPSPLS